MAIQQLPQELVDEILGCLAWYSSSLKACSLVCRAWVFRCRSYLFRTFTLVPNNIIDFRELLRSPHCTFLPHIRSLKITRNYWHENDRWFDVVAADLVRLAPTDVHTHELSLTITNAGKAARADAYFHLRYRLNGWQPVPCIDMLCLFPALQELHFSNMSDGALVHLLPWRCRRWEDGETWSNTPELAPTSYCGASGSATPPWSRSCCLSCGLHAFSRACAVPCLRCGLKHPYP